MGQLGSVDLDFGIKGFDKVAKAMSWIENMGNKFTKSLPGIEKPFQSLEKTFESNIETMKGVNKEFDDYRKTLRETQKITAGLGDNKILSFFSTLNSRILKFGQQAKLMKSVGGVTGLVKMQFAQLGKTMQVAFGTGMKTQMIGILSVFSSLLPWVVLIGAAIGIMFKVWENNVGNIQGLWISFMGKISKSWAQFDLQLRKVLLVMSPLFKAVFTPIFQFLGGFIQGALEMFTELLWLFGTVGKVLSPVIQIFANLFGMGNKVNGMFGGLGKTIGRFVAIALTVMIIVKVIHAVIAVVNVLKIAWLVLNAAFLASPIGWIVLAVVAIIAVIVLLVKHFDKVKTYFKAMVDFWVKGFKIFKDIIGKSPDWLLALIFPMGLIIKHFGKIKTVFKAVWTGIKIGLSFIGKAFMMWFDNIKKPFEVIWEYIQKVIGAWGKVKGFFSGDKKTIDVESNVKSSGAATTNSVANNTNVTVNSSGNINEASASRIGEGFAQGVNKNNMMG